MRIASSISLLLITFLNFYRFQLPMNLENGTSLFDLLGALAWALMFVHAMVFKRYRETYSILLFLALCSLQWAWKEYNKVTNGMFSDWIMAGLFLLLSIFVYIFTPKLIDKAKRIKEWNTSIQMKRK